MKTAHGDRSRLTVSDVTRFLTYDQATGILTWKPDATRTSVSGKRAGHLNKTNGYRYTSILNVQFCEHRLAWAITHGVWPTGQIDHINGIRDDNRIENLRDVSASVNMQNRKKPQSNNTSGFLGVTKHRNRWRALLTINGKPTVLGSFDSPRLAYEVYLQRKRIEHKGCTI